MVLKPAIRERQVRANKLLREWWRNTPVTIIIGKIAMCKAILTMLLAVVSINAVAAEWVEVSRSDNTAAYANLSTIRKAGNRVKMWTLLDFQEPRHVSGSSFMSIMGQNEYDCKEKQSRDIYISFISENMGAGVTIHSESEPGKWSPITPDSIDESLWETACRKR